MALLIYSQVQYKCSQVAPIHQLEGYGSRNTVLKVNPYFSRLSPDELNSAKELVFEKNVERGDIIVLEGEPAEALYFVGTGVVKMSRTSIYGKEQVLNIVRPGDSFNDVPVFDGGPNFASAQAIGPVTLTKY